MVANNPQFTNVWNDKNITRSLLNDRVWYKYGLKIIKKHNIRDCEALDVGCGVGEFMEMLQERGLNPSGVDGNLAQINSVRQAGFSAELVNLEEKLPFANGSYGFVSCLEVIEHISRAENLLSEISRIMTPNGFFLISTPNFSFWQNRIKYLLGEASINEGIHLRFFTAQTFREKLISAGFFVEDTMSISPLTGVNSIFRRLGYHDNFFVVPKVLENILAYDLIYLCKKGKS